jgi:hypothetical protein
VTDFAYRPRSPRDEIDDTMVDLRKRGMTYTAIAVAIDVFCGYRLTEHQVRYRCRQFGAPPARARRPA